MTTHSETHEDSKLYDKIDRERLKTYVQELCRFDRLTGGTGAEQAAAYIVDTLKEFDIGYERYQFDNFFSDPVKGQVLVSALPNDEIKAKARSFCPSVPEGIEGELVYDEYSSIFKSGSLEEEEWLKSLAGKVVLSRNYYEDYVKKLEYAGVKALIHIWHSSENVIHEETVGPIWGTPTIENVRLLPKIPVVGITKKDGESLIKKLQEGPFDVLVKTEMTEGIKKVSLPVAFIPGETEEYILVSSHYDSWYMGATDNAVGNALCLELARVFSQENTKRLRGIKFAWWPSHSNGRYSGSAWYRDHFWKDLDENCIAHINIDSPGSQGGEKIIARSSMLEDRSWLDGTIGRFLGEAPLRTTFLPRGADQSFWGVNIPLHINLKYQPEVPTEANSPGSGGGWWWHTEEDLLDKVNFDLLYRDTKIHASLIQSLVLKKVLPLDLTGFLENAEVLLKEIDQQSDKEFDFTPIYDEIEQLLFHCKSEKLVNLLGTETANKLLKNIGGSLNRLMFSSVSKYEFDLIEPFEPFPGISKVKNIYRENTSAETFLFTQTYFVRQRIRFIEEMKRVREEFQRVLREAEESL